MWKGHKTRKVFVFCKFCEEYGYYISKKREEIIQNISQKRETWLGLVVFELFNHFKEVMFINSINYNMWNKIVNIIKKVSYYSFGKIHVFRNIRLKKSGTVAQQNAV